MTVKLAYTSDVSVDPNGEPCPCGQRGCLERYASAAAISRVGGGESQAQAVGRTPEWGVDLGEAINDGPSAGKAQHPGDSYAGAPRRSRPRR